MAAEQRRPNSSGSNGSPSAWEQRGGRGNGTHVDANLSRNKGMVLSALSNKVTSKFKAFCKTELMDRFLHSCIEYFAAFFDLQQYLSEVAEEASRSESIKAGWPRDVDETRPHAVGLGVQPGRVVELEELAGARLRDVAALYAAILVQHSNYANTQQDRVFFETLYDFTARVLFTINDRKRWHAIENELGRVFRSNNFNLALRKNEGGTKPRTSKELYASGGKDSVIRETSHQSRHTSIHAAMHMRSPMVATIFPTPKERMQRAAESKPRAPALGETQQFADTSVKRAPETTRVTKTENEDGRTSEQLMEETILEAAQRFDEVVG